MTRMHSPRCSAFGALVLVPLAWACASSSATVNPFEAAAGGGQIHVKVVNENFYDATIWAVVNGARQHRLGVVTGKQNADFKMTWTVPQPLQFEIDLRTGNKSCVTDQMVVDPGDELELQIRPDLGQMGRCR